MTITEHRPLHSKNSIHICHYHFHYLEKQNWNQKTHIAPPALLWLTPGHSHHSPEGLSFSCCEVVLSHFFICRNCSFSMDLISTFCLTVCKRRAQAHPVVALTCSAAWVVGAAGQASVAGSRWAGTEGTCAFAPFCDPRVSSSKFRKWRSPFTLKFLLGHHLSAAAYFSFPITSGTPWKWRAGGTAHRKAGDGATHAHSLPGQHPPTSPEFPQLLLRMEIPTQSRLSSRSDGRQGKRLCERLPAGPGIELPEVAGPKKLPGSAS